MRSDVQHAALKAAAKVAFSVAVLNGCSGAIALDGREKTGDDADSNESAIASGGSKGAGSEKPSAKPCPDASAAPDTSPTSTDAGPAKPSCEALLAATFPTPGE